MNDTIEALERLARLKEQGVLTEAEFERQKAVLLAAPPGESRQRASLAQEVSAASDAAANRKNHSVTPAKVLAVALAIGAFLVWVNLSGKPSEVGILPTDPARIARQRAEMGLPPVEQAQAAATAAHAAQLADCRKLVDELQTSGLITRYSTRETGGDVYVDPRVWALIDIENKRLLGAAFACIVKNGDLQRDGSLFVRFYDTLSGKRVATMSSVGFQVE